MKYSKLGPSGINVSILALGTWGISGDRDWGPQDEDESIAAIHASLDCGMNFIDTAEAYGENGYSETVIGKALRGRRSKAVIASKVSTWHLKKDDVIRSCEQSLSRLKTDYIDLYQIHYPNHDVPFEETFSALETLLNQGKVRNIGVCNFGINDMDKIIPKGTFVTNQLPYSLLWRAIEYGIKQKCTENKLGILCYSPLTVGLLTGKFQSPDEVPAGRARTRHFSKGRPHTRHGEGGCEGPTFQTIEKIRSISANVGLSMVQLALGWLMRKEGVTSILAGARNPHQAEENAKASELEIPEDTIEALDQATEELKQKLGGNADVYQSDSRIV